MPSRYKSPQTKPSTLKSGRFVGLVSLMLLSSVTALISCQSKQKEEAKGLGGIPTPVSPTTPPVELKAPPSTTGDKSPLLARPLTSAGDNSDARFSADGSRIVFVSRNRSTHRHAQVYEYNLMQKTERRLTFHDGDDYRPVWRPDGKSVVYSSATDEAKEPPNTVERMMKNYYPNGLKHAPKTADGTWGYTELYELPIGSEIERLTYSPGFDGDVDLDLKSGRLVFSSSRAGAPHLYMMNPRSVPVRLTEGKAQDRAPFFSPDGKRLVWSRQEADSQKTTLQTSEASPAQTRKPKTLTPPSDATDTYPAWHPLGEDIIFSSNRGGKAFNLFTVDRNGQCIKRLTEVESDQLQPSFSPDGKFILFTWIRSGQSQIYMMEYRPPKDCWLKGQPVASEPTGPAPASITEPSPAAEASSTP